MIHIQKLPARLIWMRKKTKTNRGHLFLQMLYCNDLIRVCQLMKMNGGQLQAESPSISEGMNDDVTIADVDGGFVL